MGAAKVLLLGFTVPEAIARDLFAHDSLPAVQTHKFAWSLARSLKSALVSVVLASSCPIQNYPLGKKLFFKNIRFRENGFDGALLGFINVLLLKQVSRFLSCLFRVPRLLLVHDIEWLILHGTHLPFLLFALGSRMFGKKVAVVLTDPPGIILPTDGSLTRILKRVDAVLIGISIRYTDAVIALAPGLVDRFAPNKRCIVVPGILSSTFARRIAETQRRFETSDSPFVIVYAGGLSAAYGVDRLIDAVTSIAPSAIRLRLFGRGDQADRIKALAARDARFEYGGFVDDDVLVPELLGADLLVNPRPTDKDFVSLSFPSKLIEYLATGRAVLTTRLESIPDTYHDCFYYISDESPEGIRKAILSVMEIDREERLAHSARARLFVNKEASEEATGQKIAELLSS